MPSPKFWTPDPALVGALCRHCEEEGFHRILDIGPGERPFPKASSLMGWEGNASFTNYICDLTSHAPYPMKMDCKRHDFVYCRHVIEDLYNPVPLLEALNHCRAGYVECPSPAAELAQGVDAFRDGDAPWRGYMHHHWIVWVGENNVLYLTPKYTLAQHVDTPAGIGHMLESQRNWNVGLLWGPDEDVETFNYRILLHERDYRMEKDYADILALAVVSASHNQTVLYNRLSIHSAKESDQEQKIVATCDCPTPPIPFESPGDDDPPIVKQVEPVETVAEKFGIPEEAISNSQFNPMGHENPLEDEAAVQELASQHAPVARRAIYETTGPPQSPQKELAWDYWNRRFPIAVEIGSWAGATTRILAKAGFRTFAVDHWLGNPNDRLGDLAASIGPQEACKTFCRNMADNLFSSVFPLVGSSRFWASVWPEYLKIDFLYIDASHDYEDVLRDIQDWTPHVRPGGIIAGHDFGIFAGVDRAVRQTGIYLITGRTVWWRRKA